MLDSTGFFIVLVTSFFTSFSCFWGSGSLKVKISGAGLEEASGSMRKGLLHALQSILEPMDLCCTVYLLPQLGHLVTKGINRNPLKNSMQNNQLIKISYTI
jgi:hypothetical protein